MKLLGKKKKDKDSAQNEESAPLDPDRSGGDNESTPGNEEEDILSQYASADQALQEDEPEEKDALDEALADSKDDDDDVSGELMDIFTSEEAEGGKDLGVLIDILEDIDIHSLVEEAKNVETRLRNLVQATR